VITWGNKREGKIGVHALVRGRINGEKTKTKTVSQEMVGGYKKKILGKMGRKGKAGGRRNQKKIWFLGN